MGSISQEEIAGHKLHRIEPSMATMICLLTRIVSGRTSRLSQNSISLRQEHIKALRMKKPALMAGTMEHLNCLASSDRGSIKSPQRASYAWRFHNNLLLANATAANTGAVEDLSRPIASCTMHRLEQFKDARSVAVRTVRVANIL